MKRRRDKEAAIIAERRARIERRRDAKLHGGVTLDGFNYFFSVAEMDEWVKEQKAKLMQLIQSLKVRGWRS